MPSSKRIFISYSSKDRDIVLPISRLLKISSVSIFIDHDIEPGDKWEVEIFDNLTQSDAVIIFWSENSKKSSYVKEEYEAAIRLNKKIVPVLLDNTQLVDAISVYQAINMKSLMDKYKKARLAKDLTNLGLLTGFLLVPVLFLSINMMFAAALFFGISLILSSTIYLLLREKIPKIDHSEIESGAKSILQEVLLSGLGREALKAATWSISTYSFYVYVNSMAGVSNEFSGEGIGGVLNLSGEEGEGVDLGISP